jgi:hypothetical protein
MMRSTATAIRWSRAASVAACAAVLAVSTAVAAPLEVRLANGIRATVHSPEDILATMTHHEAGHLWMTISPSVQYELVDEITDPIIVNRGDGSFHPMLVETVVEALDAITFEGAGLDIDVFVLPYPRREVLDSSARDGMILLSPGTRPVSEYAVHFTVTHEVGHVFQYTWLPDSDVHGWRRYNGLRGILDPATYQAAGEHRNRPHEIFAEDFRYFFGGEMANYSGGIENDALRLPSEVEGLESFMIDLSDTRRALVPSAAIDSSPNPFNPSTEIQLRFETYPAFERARVRVFDAQGREVRSLYDEVPSGRQMRLTWDGRTTGGARVSSGLYFARLDYLGETFSTKLLLVK